MDQAVGTAFAGVGLAVIVAKSAVGCWIIRRPVNALTCFIAERIFGVYDLKMPAEWCLYCTGFWCGVLLSLCGYGLLENPVMTGLVMTGLLWPLAELTDLFAAIWYFFSEGTGDDGPHSDPYPGDSGESPGESRSS